MNAYRLPSNFLSTMTRKLEYTRAATVLQQIHVDMSRTLCVVGDPNSGSYEWAVIRHGNDAIESHSNCGYGDCAIALRDGLCAYFGNPEGGAK